MEVNIKCTPGELAYFLTELSKARGADATRISEMMADMLEKNRLEGICKNLNASTLANMALAANPQSPAGERG